MEAIRISATDLDQLRYFRDADDMELADLIARLKHLAPSSEMMEAGTALHKALETAEPGEHNGFELDGFTFSFETDAEIDLPPIREGKATKEFTVGDVVATVVGKVDAMHGRWIADHKFTVRFDADRYLNSYQWRLYLDIFDADEFRWNVFEAIESAPRNYLIRNFHPLRIHRYPGMAEDVAREVAEFVQFARQHLPERFVRAAA